MAAETMGELRTRICAEYGFPEGALSPVLFVGKTPASWELSVLAVLANDMTRRNLPVTAIKRARARMEALSEAAKPASQRAREKRLVEEVEKHGIAPISKAERAVLILGDALALEKFKVSDFAKQELELAGDDSPFDALYHDGRLAGLQAQRATAQSNVVILERRLAEAQVKVAKERAGKRWVKV